MRSETAFIAAMNIGLQRFSLPARHAALLSPEQHRSLFQNVDKASMQQQHYQWLNGSAASALGIRTRGPGFDSRVVPLFRWVATLGKLFTHIASPVSQLQETGVHKGVFSAKVIMVIKCIARLS